MLKPNHWNISIIRDFILLTGPVSSMSEFLTFFVLLRAFHASEPLFHTGWFVESLATETLVLPIIRTAANPFRNRPTLPLVITVLAVVAVGLGLPFSPLAGRFWGPLRCRSDFWGFWLRSRSCPWAWWNWRTAPHAPSQRCPRHQVTAQGCV